MTLAIDVENLTKYYGRLLAVDHISFQVKEGELFGFLGPNGAGKTTTQRILTGVIEANDGNAEIMGYDIREEAFHAKSIMGIVPEAANPYIDLSAWDNLILMGQLYNVPRERRNEKASLFLKMFELYERRNQKVKTFSKGMKQRLLLSMALISEPRILFLDEPTAGLDVQSARFIRNLIGELNGEGITVFLTTHNLEEANQLCHRIAIIDHGKIATIDSPQNLRRAFQRMQSVEIGFATPFNRIGLLEKLTGVSEVKRMGNSFRLYTEDPSRVIQELTNLAQEQNLRFAALNTLGPSLEEVFIKITEEHIGWDYEK
jgi:ABC-2 type transport system ATP-binding protein